MLELCIRRTELGTLDTNAQRQKLIHCMYTL